MFVYLPIFPSGEFEDDVWVEYWMFITNAFLSNGQQTWIASGNYIREWTKFFWWM